MDTIRYTYSVRQAWRKSQSCTFSVHLRLLKAFRAKYSLVFMTQDASADKAQILKRYFFLEKHKYTACSHPLCLWSHTAALNFPQHYPEYQGKSRYPASSIMQALFNVKRSHVRIEMVNIWVCALPMHQPFQVKEYIWLGESPVACFSWDRANVNNAQTWSSFNAVQRSWVKTAWDTCEVSPGVDAGLCVFK